MAEDPADLEQKVWFEIVNQVAWTGRPDQAPALALGEPRRMMLPGQHTLMPSILDCELPVIAAVNGTAAGRDCQEGISSFQEHRDPVWRGF